jgi:hypothetical protein
MKESDPRLAKHALPWLLVYSFLGLLLLYQIPVTQEIDLGGPLDQSYLQGFYFREVQNGATVRWSGPVAQLTFPGAGVRAWRLRLRLSGLRPDGPAHINLDANGDPLGGIDAGGEMAEYAINVPPAARAWGQVTVNLSTQPFTAPPDTRQLGVMVDWARLEPEGLGLVVPAWGVLAGLLACIAAAYGTVRRLVPAPEWAVRAGVAVAILAGAAIVLTRPLVSAYLPLLVGLGILLWLISRGLRGAAWWEWLMFIPLVWSAWRFADRAVDFYHTGMPPGDFSIFFKAADNFRLGLPMYDFAVAKGMPMGQVYKYPPLAAILLAPTTIWPAANVAAGWYLVSIALLALSFWLITRKLADVRLPPGALMIAASAVLLFGPAWEGLIRGQPDTLILACVVLALVLLEEHRAEPIAGALIAFVAMLKIYPALLCFYLLWRRRWSALAGFAVTFGLLVLLSGWMVGWGTLWRYVTEILTVQSGAMPYAENQSFNGFLARLFVPGEITTWYTIVQFPRLILLGLYLLDIVVLVLTFALLWRVPERERGVFKLGYGAVMPLIVLIWPIAWIHYQTLLLLPFGLLFIWIWAAGPRAWPVGVVLLGSFLLVALGNEWTVARPALLNGWPKLLQSYKLLGVLILWLLLIYSGRHPARGIAPAPAQQAARAAARAIPLSN